MQIKGLNGKRLFIFLFLILITILSGYKLGSLSLRSLTNIDSISDFGVYYYIPKAVLELARAKHPYANFTPIYPYFYPPASILIFKPLLFLPFYLAKYFWTFFNIAVLGGSLVLINKTIDSKINYKFWIMLFLSAFFFPNEFTIIDGQLNLVLFFVYTYGLYALKNNKDTSGGVLLGLGTITKISPAIILFYALIKKRFKLIAAAVVTFLLTVIGAEYFIKEGINYYYARHVLPKVSRQAADSINYRDQSILAFFKRFYIFSKNSGIELNLFGKELGVNHLRSLVSYIVTGIIISTFGLVEMLRKEKSRYNLEINYAILTIVGIIGTGLTWYHQYSIMLLPLFLFLGLALKVKHKRKKYRLLGLGLIIYLGMFKDLEGTFRNYWLHLNLLYSSLVLLAALFYLKFKQKDLFTSNIKEKTGSLISNKYKSVMLFTIFIAAFIIALNPIKLPETLRESRDKARIKEITYMGNVLEGFKPNFEKGTSNSVKGNERLDGNSYILFKDRDDNKVRTKLSILLLDPINNSNYKYTFESTGGSNFTLKAKLESKKYIKDYGERFTYTK